MIHSEQVKAINKDVQSQIDSTVRATIQAETERILNSVTNTETDLIVFDTDKPVNDSTGLPPVKAVAKTRSKTKQVQKENAKQQAQVDIDVSKTNEDHSTEQSVATIKEEQKSSWWATFKQRIMDIMIALVILIVGLLTIWGLYKLLKFKYK